MGLYTMSKSTIDLSGGQYSVRVQTGPAYNTRRQEAAQFLVDIIGTDQGLMRIFGDLLFKNLDFAGAPVMAERIKKIMDPSVFDDEENPLVMQLQQQLKEQTAIMQALQAEVNTKKAELVLKARAEENDTEESKAKIELDFYRMQSENEIKVRGILIRERELALKEREMTLKEAELQAKALQGMDPVVAVQV